MQLTQMDRRICLRRNMLFVPWILTPPYTTYTLTTRLFPPEQLPSSIPSRTFPPETTNSRFTPPRCPTVRSQNTGSYIRGRGGFGGFRRCDRPSTVIPECVGLERLRTRRGRKGRDNGKGCGCPWSTHQLEDQWGTRLCGEDHGGGYWGEMAPQREEQRR